MSKKRFFETAARLFGNINSEISAEVVYAALLAREKLGSTALGSGVAIPHCRIANCSRAVGGLITLSEKIDFEAPDRQGVDILFVLLVPQESHQDHLDILAGLAELLSQASFCSALRAGGDRQQLYNTAVTFTP